jgi:hypothetical protein
VGCRDIHFIRSTGWYPTCLTHFIQPVLSDSDFSFPFQVEKAALVQPFLPFIPSLIFIVHPVWLLSQTGFHFLLGLILSSLTSTPSPLNPSIRQSLVEGAGVSCSAVGDALYPRKDLYFFPFIWLTTHILFIHTCS